MNDDLAKQRTGKFNLTASSIDLPNLNALDLMSVFFFFINVTFI